MQSRSNTMTASMPFGKAASEKSWRNVVVLLFCGAVLASGFFFAARQHFSSMELGIKNSQLRNQLSELEAENRRLELAKEVAMSPMAIRKASHLIRPRTEAPAIVADIAAMKAPTPSITKTQAADTESKAALTKAVKSVVPDEVIIKTSLTKPVAKPQTAGKPAKGPADVKTVRQKV